MSEKNEEYADAVRVSAGTKFAVVVPGRKRLKVKTAGWRTKYRGGMVRLWGKWYGLVPKRMGRTTGRRLRSLYILPVDYHIQFWKEDNPEPIPLFDEDENPPKNRTGEKIAMFIDETAIRKVVGVPSSILIYILLLVAGAAIGWLMGGYFPAETVNGAGP